MIRACAWCKKTLGLQAPLADTRTTHGICDICLERELKQLEGTTMDNFLWGENEREFDDDEYEDEFVLPDDETEDEDGDEFEVGEPVGENSDEEE